MAFTLLAQGGCLAVWDGLWDFCKSTKQYTRPTGDLTQVSVAPFKALSKFPNRKTPGNAGLTPKGFKSSAVTLSKLCLNPLN